MSFLGADTERLRSHGGLVGIRAGRIDEMIQHLRGVVAGTSWEGPDAESFRSGAQGAFDAAQGAVELLLTRGEELLRHADEQDQASGLEADAAGLAESGSKVKDDGTAEGTEPLDEDIPLEGEDTQIENTAQGSIADCYLLSSLGAITQLDPDFLDQHVEEIDDGVYRVIMYDKDGNEITYVVESTPENGARFDTEDGGHSVFSIYERAYQMHLEQQGEGDTLDWGMPTDAMQTMTGQEASYYMGESTPSLEHMAELIENGRPMTADTGGISEPAHDDIAGQHAYKVSAVDVEAGTVTVVNPWGGNESVTMSYEQYVETFQGTAIGRTEAPSFGDRVEEIFDGTAGY